MQRNVPVLQCSQVSMVIDDDLVPIWRQVISNHHADVGRAMHIRSTTTSCIQVPMRHHVTAIFGKGCGELVTWWRHQMETFSALLALCAGNSPVPGEFPAQRPVTRSFDVFFDLLLYTRLSKQPWVWWFETPSCSLWRHCNDYLTSNRREFSWQFIQ